MHKTALRFLIFGLLFTFGVACSSNSNTGESDLNSPQDIGTADLMQQDQPSGSDLTGVDLVDTAIDGDLTGADLADMTTDDGVVPLDSMADVISSTKSVGPAGGSLELSGVRLEIPAGALQQQTTLTLSLSANDIDPPGGVRLGTAVEITPHTTFNKPARLTMPYEKASLPNGRTESELRIFTTNTLTDPWRVLPGVVNSGNGLIGVEVPHLSFYVVGLPQTPVSTPNLPPLKVIPYDSTGMGGNARFGGYSFTHIGNDGSITMMGLIASGTTNFGIYTGQPGQLTLIMSDKEKVPGLADTINFELTFSDVLINGNNFVLSARLNGTDAFSNRAIISGPLLGEKKLVMQHGVTAAPGTDATLTTPTEMRVNAAGKLAFATTTINGTTCKAGNSIINCGGVWFGDTDGLQKVLYSGDPAPGAPGDVYEACIVSGLGNPALNDNDELAIRGCTRTPDTGTGNWAVWFGGVSSLKLLARTGDTAPNGANPFGKLGEPAVNNSGQVVFVDEANGVWLWKSDVLTQIAKIGDALPEGGTLTGFWDTKQSKPAIGGGGYVVFYGDIDNGGGTALFGYDGTLKVLAQTGKPAPGSGGLTFKSFETGITFANIKGQTGFLARLSDDRDGIWLTDPSGTLHLVALEGELLELGPDQALTIDALYFQLSDFKSATDGQHFLNDNGELIWGSTFKGLGFPNALLVSVIPGL